MKKKILIEMRHGYGDLVMLEPLLYLLKKNGYKVTIILKSQSHYEMIKKLDLVEKYFIFDFFNKKKIIENIRTILQIRKIDFDYGIISPITPISLGIKFMKILGVKNFIYNNQAKNKIEHYVDINLNLSKQLNINENKKIYPKLKLDENEINRYKDIIKGDNKKTVNIILSTLKLYKKRFFVFKKGIDCKNWGLNNFINLIKILEKEEYQIILTGVLSKEKEKLLNDNLKNSKNIKNFVNKTSLIEAAILSYLSDIVVGNDTGGIHIASALGKKTLSIFGPTDPRKVGAYSEKAEYITTNIECQYCYGTDKLFECNDRKCLKNIKVEKVFKAIKERM